MIRLVPFVIPHVDYDALIAGGSELAGRVLGTGIDRRRGALADALVVLGDIQQPGIYSYDALKRADRVLQHLSFGFLVEAPADLMLILIGDGELLVTSGSPFIVSGSLALWKRSITRALVEESRRDVRFFFNGVYVFLERLGLGEIWAGRHKRMLDDATFILD